MKKVALVLVAMVMISLAVADVAGLLRPVGSPGTCDDATIRCSPTNPNEVEYCVNNNWYVFATCENVACIDPGYCPSEPGQVICTDGTTKCDSTGSFVQMCSNNHWTLYQNCQYGCSGGECNSAPQPSICTDGETRCDPNDLNGIQQCVNNQWIYLSTCQYGNCYGSGECPNEPVQVDPQIIETSTPSVVVTGNIITATFYLRNTGGDMTDYSLIELEVRNSEYPLSWLSSVQQVCDAGHTENVHKMFKLDAGESLSITLETEVPSGRYGLFVTNTDKCCVDTEGNQVYPECQSGEPYYFGHYIKDVKVGSSTCGDYTCQSSENKVSCPEDCNTVMSNVELTDKLQTVTARPLVGGVQLEHQGATPISWGICTLGAIVKKSSKNYILTAGHCVSIDDEKFADSADIGAWAIQGGSIVAHVYKVPSNGANVDAALLSIDGDDLIPSELENYLGAEIVGFGDVRDGMRVYKIGRTTGLTYGVVTDDDIHFVDSSYGDSYEFEITGENGAMFCDQGDSGSAIITADKPYRIVGILSSMRTDLGGTVCYSSLPEDIQSELGLPTDF